MKKKKLRNKENQYKNHTSHSGWREMMSLPFRLLFNFHSLLGCEFWSWHLGKIMNKNLRLFALIKFNEE